MLELSDAYATKLIAASWRNWKCDLGVDGQRDLPSPRGKEDAAITIDSTEFACQSSSCASVHNLAHGD
jgi:hypothetical protein